jgi:hypothetical protein
MEVFMNVMQYFAGGLFVVCLLGFIVTYSLILVKAAKVVGAKISKLVMELVSRTVGSY